MKANCNMERMADRLGEAWAIVKCVALELEEYERINLDFSVRRLQQVELRLRLELRERYEEEMKLL